MNVYTKAAIIEVTILLLGIGLKVVIAILLGWYLLVSSYSIMQINKESNNVPTCRQDP